MIVAFTGKAGCGKSSVAQALCTRTYSFASPIKEMAFKMGWNGKKDYKGRKLLQDIGTIGREYKKNLWITKLVNHIADDKTTDDFYANNNIYGIDDLRYENEASAVHALGGIIIYLKHSTVQTGNLDSHPSEKGIPEYARDYEIPYGNLEDVIAKAKEIIEKERDNEQNRASKT